MSRPVIEIWLRRIKLDRDGYDAIGSYYGIGAPVWNMSTPYSNHEINQDFRAADLQSARTYVRSAVDHNHKADVKFVR